MPSDAELTRITFVIVLALIAICALLVAVVMTDSGGARAAIGVATACVAVLATLVSRMGKQ